MFTLTIKSFLALASAVAFQVMPAEPTMTYIAEAKTNSLASSYLIMEKVPETVLSAEEEITLKAEIRQDPPKNEIMAIIKKAFPKEPLMLKVADCESIGLRHYINGKVLRGEVVKEDVGLFQINETYWLKKSLELGIDIYDLEGNIKMARYIYDTQGLSAWSASFRNCWKNF